MTTAERIKELANKLSEEADYYGAFIDEMFACKDLPYGELDAAFKKINLHFSKIDRNTAYHLLLYLASEAAERNLSPLN